MEKTPQQTKTAILARMNCENTAVICKTWNSNDKKILPKKFLLKFIPNESVEARNIRRFSTFERFQAEINLLKIRARNHNTKAKQIDEEMNAFLQSKFKDEHLNNLKDLWVEESTAEEYKSSKLWESKQRWLEKYAAKFNNNDFTKAKMGKNGNVYKEPTLEKSTLLHLQIST